MEILQDRYEIQRQLGKKAGRQTLLARDRTTQSLVILKLLTFNADFEWDDLKLFEREIETLKALDHPAIPKYLDSFELKSPTQKGFGLVQSYLEAPSLKEHLEAGRTFSEREVKQIVRSLLEILQDLHDRHPPIIHRDIKPSNILLNSPGKIYLIDFGSVQTLATQAGKTVTVVGTYGYMPPEQFGGISAPASDLYSVGMSAIALLTRQHPADLPQENLQVQFESSLVVSPHFATWLNKITHPNPMQRFNSSRQALAALDGALDAIPQFPARSRNTAADYMKEALIESTAVGITTCAIAGVVVGICSSLIVGPTAVFFAFLFSIVGGIWGFAVGLFNGLVVGLVTRLGFYPLKRPELHLLVASAASLASIALLTWVAFTVSQSYYERFPPYDDRYSDFRSSVLPAIAFATVAMLFHNQHLIDKWHKNK
jgi:eukaryotic-like serine/threonine-protein kinase